MARGIGPEFDGAGLANELDALFRSGGINSLAIPAVPENKQIIPEQTQTDLRGGQIENFLSSVDLQILREVNRRAVSDGIRVAFDTWQTVRTLLLEKSMRSKEAEIVDKLTLKDVAIYAKEQFELHKKNAATLEPGSPAQIWARDETDRWSILEEVLSPAADED